MQEGQVHDVCIGCGGSALAPYFVRHGYRLVRCDSCHLVFVANPPTDAELERHYSFASGYHVNLRDDPESIEQRSRLAEEKVATIARHSEPGQLLDVGATAGFFVRAAAGRGWHAMGVELSDDTAKIAREQYGLDVRTGTLDDVELPGASFDAVTLWDVIEHVRDPRGMLERTAAALKPGGIVAITTPNLDGLYPRLSYPVARLLRYWPAVEPPAHLTQFSTRTLGDLLDRTGFDIVEVEHECQPLGYTFGPRQMLLHGKGAIPRLLYAAIFAPLAWIGSRFRSGDEIAVIARKRAA